MIKKSELGEKASAIGELVGLLSPGGDPNSLVLNSDWFKKPVSEIGSLGTRFEYFAEIIETTLGPGATDPPKVFADAQWYAIPNPWTGVKTPFQVVISSDTDTTGELGIGILEEFGGGSANVAASVFLPLFTYSPAGMKFILDSADSPVQIRLDASGDFRPANTNVTFSSMSIVGKIPLAGASPTFELSFTDLKGTTNKGPFTSLKSLLDPDVELWIGDVLIQAGTWLNKFVGNSQFTIGDIIESADFLRRDYTVSEANIKHVSIIADAMTAASDPVSTYLWGQLSSVDQNVLKDTSSTDEEKTKVLSAALTKIVEGKSIYETSRFDHVVVIPQAVALIAESPQGYDLVKLNRLLLQSSYALAFDINPYNLNLDNLKGSASDIALNLVFAVLDALSAVDFPLISLPGGGTYITRVENPDGSSDYGLRLASEIKINADPGNNGASGNQQPSAKAPPEVDIAVGPWLGQEDATNSWVERSSEGATGVDKEPGFSLVALHRTKEKKLSFAPGFALSSVGMNLKGGKKDPLFNIKGYVLEGIELRAYLSKLPESGWEYGFAAALDGIGVPLGPAFGDSTKETDNKVAQSLLSSGSDDSGNGKKGDQDPINPSFGISAAWIHGGKLVFQLYDKDGKPTQKVWIPIQRALGPLQCEKIGIKWVDKSRMLTLIFDGGVKLSSLNIDLVDLSIAIPVSSPGDFSSYKLDLAGLGITMKTSSIDLSAAFVKLGPDPTATPPRTWTEYDGEAIVKFGTFALSAVGSYAYVGSDTSGFASLFIFAILDADLGDPTGTGGMYITGLAGGFGYNRALKLPDMNDVPSYPLVQATNDPAALGQTPGQPPDPAKALQKFDDFVPPERGEYWFAGGLRFTSFDLINSTAVLTIAFGKELEIAILGLSWISLPPPVAPGAEAPAEKFAYAELGIEIKLLPSEGVFSATAILSPTSFVLDPACKLTGGFAFFVWFGSNPHAGQFVLTLGGYHPDFKPPGYFPKVPRLGFNWALPGGVSISGDTYFALTASAIMAGGGLQILFHAGPVRAWFKADLNVLIEWAPFYFSAGIGVDIGVSLTLKIIFVTVTLKLELGADLELKGPPIGGVAHVHLFIFSFTIHFGDEATEAPALPWTNDDGTGFAQTLLSHRTQKSDGAMQLAALPAADVATPVVPQGLYTIAVNDGLLKDFEHNGEKFWIVRGNHFVFSTVTGVPCTAVNITKGIYPEPTPPSAKTSYGPNDCVNPDPDYFVALRPMKATLKSSEFTVTLTDELAGKTYDLAGEFDVELACGGVPAAKWGKPLAKDEDPAYNKQLPSRLLGLKNIRPKMPKLSPTGNDALDINVRTAFTYDVVDGEVPYHAYHLPLRRAENPVGSVPTADDDAIDVIESSLQSKTVTQTRSKVLGLLQQYGVKPVTNGDLSNFEADPGKYLNGNPLIQQSA